MTVATSLIPGLDEIVRNGDPERRAEARAPIAELFFQDAANLRPDHVDLFDGLLTDLVPHADLRARRTGRTAVAARQRAARLVGQLARENEILVAGPCCAARRCSTSAPARDRAGEGTRHLLAMSERPTLSTDLTDVIIRRGDREVVRRAAGNAGAQFSQGGIPSWSSAPAGTAC